MTNEGKIGSVLFTKRDRLGKNAGDTYQMISLLLKQGTVEPAASIMHQRYISIPE
jgi:DNA invertase Pin-like site-specific DNA recombinase